MIVFHHFLHCISLKSFGKFVGWVGAVSSVLALYAVFLVVTAKAADLFTLNERYFGGERNVVSNVAIVLGTLILIGIFHTSLIFGIKKNKSMLILPYVIFTIFPIIVLPYIMITSMHFTASSEYDASSIASILGFVFSILFSIYFALCAFSLYSLIREDEKKRKVYKTCDTIFVAK